MLVVNTARIALLALSIVAEQVSAYQWPSPQYDALETLLYEGRRSDGSNLASTQHPCKLRGSTRGHIGAEWLRLVRTPSTRPRPAISCLPRPTTMLPGTIRQLGQAEWTHQ